jgi:hypothetical protein
MPLPQKEVLHFIKIFENEIIAKASRLVGQDYKNVLLR